MFRQILSAKKVNKLATYRFLSEYKISRSVKSIEYKFQNISAVLLELEGFYIPGLKPASQYQKLLFNTVYFYLQQNAQQVTQLGVNLSEIDKPTQVFDYLSILSSPPKSTVKDTSEKYICNTPAKIDFAQRELKNRKLGLCGEELVLNYEKHRLTSAGRKDLAANVEWVSQTKGDGAGFDICSFDLTTEKERFIEVKTTNSGIHQPFYISSNEVKFSEAKAEQYALYRVFEYKFSPNLFILEGNIRQHIQLEATQYLGWR